MKKKLVLPKFKNQDEEHDFWEKIDLSEYYEVKDLKPFNITEFLKVHGEQKTVRVTIRIPTNVVRQYKKKASELDVPYQSLMKQQLAKGA